MEEPTEAEDRSLAVGFRRRELQHSLALEQLAPQDRDYAHNARWGDGNGFSHVRAALTGAGFSVPFAEGRLLLGAWQQIVLMDHDNRSREREVVVQIVGE